MFKGILFYPDTNNWDENSDLWFLVYLSRFPHLLPQFTTKHGKLGGQKPFSDLTQSWDK